MLNLKNGASPDAVAEAAGGKLIVKGNKPSFNAVIDSRKVKDGDIFVAIKGEKTDGHEYIANAAESGASVVITEREDIDKETLVKNGCSAVLVKSSTIALGNIARVHKSEYKAITVGVTGSVGKTTTRQYIGAVLSSHFKTHKTEGNFNNELGLPLTLLSLDGTHEASVLEMGMSAKGEISYLTNIAHPDIAVITNIGTAHIEYLGSREGIRDAKMEITEGLKKDGKLILCGDEPLLAGKEGAIYCSLKNPGSDYTAQNIRSEENGTYFDVKCRDGLITDMYIPTFGEHTVLDALYAVAVGRTVGMTYDEIRNGLSMYEGVGNRQEIVIRCGTTLVFDYYNASLESIIASLKVTKNIAARNKGRTVAVLGDVYELGGESARLHGEIGDFVASLGCDKFFAFGKEMVLAAERAVRCGMNAEDVFVFPDISDARPLAECVMKNIKEKDCVLFKSSHSVGMDRVTDIILSESKK